MEVKDKVESGREIVEFIIETRKGLIEIPLEEREKGNVIGIQWKKGAVKEDLIEIIDIEGSTAEDYVGSINMEYVTTCIGMWGEGKNKGRADVAVKVIEMMNEGKVVSVPFMLKDSINYNGREEKILGYKYRRGEDEISMLVGSYRDRKWIKAANLGFKVSSIGLAKPIEIEVTDRVKIEVSKHKILLITEREDGRTEIEDFEENKVAFNKEVGEEVAQKVRWRIQEIVSSGIRYNIAPRGVLK